MLALVGSYMTGFSVGGLYLPGAIALALAARQRPAIRSQASTAGLRCGV